MPSRSLYRGLRPRFFRGAVDAAQGSFGPLHRAARAGGSGSVGAQGQRAARRAVRKAHRSADRQVQPAARFVERTAIVCFRAARPIRFCATSVRARFEGSDRRPIEIEPAVADPAWGPHFVYWIPTMRSDDAAAAPHRTELPVRHRREPARRSQDDAAAARTATHRVEYLQPRVRAAGAEEDVCAPGQPDADAGLDRRARGS